MLVREFSIVKPKFVARRKPNTEINVKKMFFLPDFIFNDELWRLLYIAACALQA